MNARQNAASRELESIQEEMRKRTELVERSKKTVNALSIRVRAIQNEIAPSEGRILAALSARAEEI